MRLEQSFEVHAPLAQVWEALIDVERVAPCLPGAEITEAGDDGSYKGTFSVKLGPTKAAYDGELSLVSVDEQARRVTMNASGRDKRGQGSAKATIQSVLSAEGEGTRVEVETDFTITGKLARFGRGGMIRDVSNRLMGDFSQCLQQTIEAALSSPSPPSEATQGGGDTPPTASAAPRPTPAPPRPGPAPTKPVQGLSLFVSVMWERIKRLAARSRS